MGDRPLTHWPSGRKRDFSIPQRVVTSARMSFAEVSAGFANLRDVVSHITPDLLFGINRGGPAIGGMIAKSLGLLLYILEVDFSPASRGKVLDHRSAASNDIGPPAVIVVIDDVVRRGRHMRMAAGYLRSRYPSAEITRLALLEVAMHDQPSEVEWAPFRATRLDVKTPWEP